MDTREAKIVRKITMLPTEEEKKKEYLDLFRTLNEESQKKVIDSIIWLLISEEGAKESAEQYVKLIEKSLPDLFDNLDVEELTRNMTTALVMSRRAAVGLPLSIQERLYLTMTNKFKHSHLPNVVFPGIVDVACNINIKTDPDVYKNDKGRLYVFLEEINICSTIITSEVMHISNFRKNFKYLKDIIQVYNSLLEEEVKLEELIPSMFINHKMY